jgi:hypothetical protein
LRLQDFPQFQESSVVALQISLKTGDSSILRLAALAQRLASLRKILFGRVTKEHERAIKAGEP